jgi:hypothetical protein
MQLFWDTTQAAVVVNDVEVDDPARGRVLAEPVQGLVDRLVHEERGEILAHSMGDGIAQMGQLM